MVIEGIMGGLVASFLYDHGKRILGEGREHFAPNIIQGRNEEFVKIADRACFEVIDKFRERTNVEALKRYFSDPKLGKNRVITSILEELFLDKKWNSRAFNSEISEFQDFSDQHKLRKYDDELQDLRNRIRGGLMSDSRTANPIIDISMQHIRGMLKALPRVEEVTHAVLHEAKAREVQKYTRSFVEAWQANVRWLLVNGLDSKARRDQVINDLKSSYVPISISTIDRDGGEALSQTAEDAVVALRKVIIRGEAGSGKTTLLHKRILDFDCAKDLATQEVPLYIPLRRIEKDLAVGYRVETALKQALGDQILGGQQPLEWLSDLTSVAPNVAFMFDGIDEVRTENRSNIWKLIAETEKRFPSCRFIVTSRNISAVHLADGSYRTDSFGSQELYGEFIESWGAPSSFFDFVVRPFTNIEVANLIEKWFEGVDLDAVLPQERKKIEGYAEGLKAQIFAPENRSSLDLARNPLLCALFCIVAFLDRGDLPKSRRDLYEKATNLLVATRDAAKGVDVPPEFSLFGLDQRLAILQKIALTMQEGAKEGAVNQTIEIDKLKAIEWADNWISSGVEGWAFDGSGLLKFLLNRCSIIREPSNGRIDFVHRSFMEFLAAQEISVRRAPHSIRHTIFKDEWYNTLHFCMNTIVGGGHFAGQIFRDLVEAIGESSNKKSRRLGYLRVLALLRSADTIPEMYFSNISELVDKIMPLTDYEEAQELFGVPAEVLNEVLKYGKIEKEFGAEQTYLCAKLLSNHPSDRTKFGLLTGYEKISDIQTISAINGRGKIDVNEHYALLRRIQNKSYVETVIVRPEELSDRRLRRGARNIGIKFPIFQKEFKGWDVLHFVTAAKFLDVTRADFEKMRDSVSKWRFDSCRKLEIVHGNGVTFEDIASLLPNLEVVEFIRGQAISFRGIEKLKNLKEVWLVGVSQPVRIDANSLPLKLETILLSSSSAPIVEGLLNGCKVIIDESPANRTLYI